MTDRSNTTTRVSNKVHDGSDYLYDPETSYETHCRNWTDHRTYRKHVDGCSFYVEIHMRYGSACIASKELLIDDLNGPGLLDMKPTDIALITSIEAKLDCVRFRLSDSNGVEQTGQIPTSQLESWIGFYRKMGFKEDSQARRATGQATRIYRLYKQRHLPLTEREKDFECEQLSAKKLGRWEEE